MKSSELAMIAVIEQLEQFGFIEDGHTRRDEVLIPTTESPRFGKSGGVRAVFGNRARFKKPDTNIKCTIGKRTFYLYEIDAASKDVKTIISTDTSDIKAIKDKLAETFPKENHE